MRILPLFLSVLMIFAPAYSAYASVLPSKGQIISMGKKGGAMIKTGVGGVSKVARVGNPIIVAAGVAGAIATCAKSKKCRDKVSDIADLFCDDFECTAEHPDTPDKDGQCIVRFGDEKLTAGAFLASKTRTEQKPPLIKEYTPNAESHEMLERQGKSAIKQNYNRTGIWIYNHGKYKMDIKTTNKETGKLSESTNEYYVKVYSKCGGNDDDKRLSDDELNDLAKKIAENMDDDDIINYYNTDYGDIIINNKRYDGDDINSQTNIDNRCNNNSCNEISQEIEQDVRSKKYDIDDVNEQNCTMDKAKRKYIQCSFDFDNGHDNTQDNTNKDDISKDTKPDEKDEPPVCSTSDFFREACEYFDWVDDEADEPTDTKVDIEDEDEEPLDDDVINIMKSCPADIQFSVSMLGQSMDFEISTMPFCLVATGAKNYIVSAGTISAIFILAGVRRD